MSKKKNDIDTEELVAEEVLPVFVTFVGNGDNDPEVVTMYGQEFYRGEETDISELSDFVQAKIIGNTHFEIAD